jgi:hypothetical protein
MKPSDECVRHGRILELSCSRYLRRPDTPQQPPQHLDRVAFARAQARQRRDGELRLREGEERRLRLKAAIPADAACAAKRSAGPVFRNDP